MSVSQWKFLNHIKDSLSKINDKSLQTVISKDTIDSIYKYSVSLNNELFKYIGQFNQTPEEGPNRSSNLALAPEKGLTKVPKKAEPVPKWKTNHVSKTSLSSQTNHVLQSIESAETDFTLLHRIETLIAHLQKHPEVRNNAIRAGAVRILLKTRKRRKNPDVQSALREALATLGYAPPVKANGIRVLSMDGGGVRGLLIIEMLKKLEELTGRRVHEMFDLICGVSTGAILTFGVGALHLELDEVARRYKEISFEVFKQSPLWGTGSLVWTQAYYDTSLWEKRLREYLGAEPLIKTSRDGHTPKLCAISAVVNQSRLSAYVFRNYSLPWRVKSQYFGGYQAEVWQAARASAAAPTYLEEFKLGGFVHQDGGILVNNPTAVALHEARLLWPGTPVQCVVSFGTGRTVPAPADFQRAGTGSRSTSWADKFYKILDSATDTEGVHIMLADLLPEHVYYRFNPYLTELVSMVEIDPGKLEQMERDVVMYLRRNEDKFQEAAKVLMQEKTFLQKVREVVGVNKEIYGL